MTNVDGPSVGSIDRRPNRRECTDGVRAASLGYAESGPRLVASVTARGRAQPSGRRRNSPGRLPAPGLRQADGRSVAGRTPSRDVGSVAGRTPSRDGRSVAGRTPSRDGRSVAGRTPSRDGRSVAGRTRSPDGRSVAGRTRSRDGRSVAGRTRSPDDVTDATSARLDECNRPGCRCCRRPGPGLRGAERGAAGSSRCGAGRDRPADPGCGRRWRRPAPRWQ